MNAGIIGLDCLRFIFFRGIILRLLAPLVTPLTLSTLSRLASLPSVLMLSGSESLWKPLWPLRPLGMPFDARCVVIASMRHGASRGYLGVESGTKKGFGA